MHSGSGLVSEALKTLRAHYDGPLMAYPDSGYFEMPDWRFVDVIPPATFETFCRQWIAEGVQILGGCCGLTVAHIEAATRARAAAAA
jgi:homocysteine S-methyltransferase